MQRAGVKGGILVIFVLSISRQDQPFCSVRRRVECDKWRDRQWKTSADG